MNQLIKKRPAVLPSFLRILCLISVSLFFLTFTVQIAGSEELEMVNRPVNASGLTGLIVTTGPFILPDKSFEFSIGALSERSTRPDYSLNELPIVTVSAGVSQNSEIAFKTSWLKETQAGSSRQRGSGNMELTWKYSLYPQLETTSFPAIAFMISAVAGGNNKELIENDVLHWGARTGLSVGREIIWGNYAFGVYADGQLVVHDLNNEQVRDRYGILNAGLLVPISKNRNLQLIVEYTMVSGIDRITDQGGDYSGILYGLRVVTERFNISIGSQFIRKQVEGFENTSRVIGMMSVKL